ncbi:unnamed protein product, partial [Gulo gulo]
RATNSQSSSKTLPLREQVKEGTPIPTADQDGGLLRDPHQGACCHWQVTHHPNTAWDLAAGQTDLTSLIKSQPLVRSRAAGQGPGAKGEEKLTTRQAISEFSLQLVSSLSYFDTTPVSVLVWKPPQHGRWQSVCITNVLWGQSVEVAAGL